MPEELIVERLRRREGPPSLRRKFLLRLAVALHSYGSSAPRTEYLVEKAAERLKVDVHIAVMPALIALAFPSTTDDDSQETHLLTVTADLDVDKLGRADELANSAGGEEGREVLVAFWRLRSIARAEPAFSARWRMLAYAMLAGAAAPLFFNGNLVDAAVAFFMGYFVGLLDTSGSKNQVLSQVAEFVAALVISFLGKALALSAPASWQVCYFPIVLSSLVWLLPGLSLTIGVSELVAKAYVSGATRVVAALFSALQLGFGMALGENLVWWGEGKLPRECRGEAMHPAWQILWFFLYTFASNILLSARWDQWPGMVLVSGFAQITAMATSSMNGDVSSVISAFVIGVTGTIYSQLTGHLPLAMKTSGILLLVPGGIGVQGVAAILSDDVLSGMGFVFDMLVVGLSITIGLLLAKIVFPNALFGQAKGFANTKKTLAAQMESEKYEIGANSSSDSDEDEEEHMAI